jgi:predicted DNA-binding protein (MmcQ/YjbR family)
MNLDWIRAHCLSLPHTTENVQWEEHLLFKIGGKMYALGSLNPVHDALSLKADPDEFEALVEVPGIIPAPYMARNKWVQIQALDAVPRAEVKRLLTKSYEIVKAKLPKKLQVELTKPPKPSVKKKAAVKKAAR